MQLKTLHKFVLHSKKNLSDVSPPMDFEGVDDIGDDGDGMNGDDNGRTAPGIEDQ